MCTNHQPHYDRLSRPPLPPNGFYDHLNDVCHHKAMKNCRTDNSPQLKPLVTQENLKLASPRLRLIKAAAEVAPGVTTFDPVTRQATSRCILVPDDEITD